MLAVIKIIIVNMVSNIYLNSTLRNIDGWRGVFAADTIPINPFTSPQSKPQFVIVNTSPIRDSDGHWVLLSKYSESGNTVLEVCDSYGWPLSSLHQNIQTVLLTVKFDFLLTNNQNIQHIQSNYCGLFTIARIVSILRSESLQKHLSLYSANLSKNNQRCIDYIRTVSQRL